MIRSVAGQQEAYDNFIEWLLESEAQESYEEYVGRKQREYGILAEKKKGVNPNFCGKLNFGSPANSLRQILKG